MSMQEAKKQYIVAVAADLFLQKGIANVTIKDVSVAAGVGEATMYRHFSTKQNLVFGVAQYLSDGIQSTYFDLSSAQTGWDKLQCFYANFLRIYRERPQYYRFISEFDTTMRDANGLDEYEQSLLPYMQVYLDAYRQGLADGSVQEIEDVEMFYLTTTHALMGLCKKLTINLGLSQDRHGQQEVQILIDLILYRLQNLCV